MRVFIICIAMFIAQYANAAVTINIAQSGVDVEAVMSGNVNLGATMGLAGTAPGYNGYYPVGGGLTFTGDTNEYYFINNFWTPYGAGAAVVPWSTSAGDALALWKGNDFIGVPVGYISGTNMSATAAVYNTTLAAIEMTPGTYVTAFSAPEGPSDTVTVIVGVNDDPFTPAVSNETSPSVPEGLPGYVPDGSFAVTITDGASCTGTTYDIAVTPIASSSPLGNTPAATVPAVVINATAAGSPYIFTGGAGSYDVEVTETGLCLPLVNPEVTTATIPDAPSADLSISKVADREIAIAGDPQPLVYTVTVTNDGPFDATNVFVADVLPAGISDPTTSGCLEDPAGTPTCSLGTIAVGATATYTISVHVDSNVLGVIANQVAVNTDLPDPNPDNDIAIELTEVIGSADMSISKIGSSDVIISGGSSVLTYTIEVNNAGPSDAVGVNVNDVLPPLALFESTSGCANDPNGVPDCDLGTVIAGGSALYTIDVRLNRSDTVISNRAVVSALTDDPDLSNNVAIEETELSALPIPVNANWALMLMVLLLGGFGWTAIRRR